MALIEARNLTKIYGRQVACREICLSVEEGQIFGLLGPNGAGKSTLVKMLVGLVYPTAGEAKVAGYTPQDIRGRRRVGFLPENFRLHGWMKGEELLTFHARLAGLEGRAASRRAHEVLELVGLAGEGQKLVADYSKGMQQRLGLAAALVGDPRVVFLDEPTSALDPLGRLQVREILLALKEAGKTVFLNSHLLSEVEQVCDRVAIINRGTVVAAGRLDELQAGPATVAIRLAGLTRELVAELRRRYPELQLEGDRLTLALGGREEIADLVARLVAGGCRIYEVRPGHSSLEDVFVHLVREGEQVCG
ncbi:ABC transporter ATP-binding protein [Neomoorella humiferrea]|uniref:Putative ABC transporter ATP-binding protein YxlF n=1 Tax=Neomoorella humiferrea TaxID=676965 RepID=A0A2T0AKU7_9FIRM|nr:ABC transporter ATP-binding protein [Moorella humiferrea]PRR69143.1 putative ABC transporter ATP-binding protein YxlF [Moorella humiferrea]